MPCERSVSVLNHAIDQEPLLMESKRRFVLFPTQYPEVRLLGYVVVLVFLLDASTDLANVQKGRSLLLDC